MPIQLLQSTSQSTTASGTTITITLPTLRAAGNVIVLFTHVYRGASAPVAPITPSGWTYIGSTVNTTICTSAYYRVVTGSEASTLTITNGDTATRFLASMHLMGGVDTQDVILAYQSSENESVGQTSSLATAAITAANGFLLSATGIGTNQSNITNDAALTEFLDFGPGSNAKMSVSGLELTAPISAQTYTATWTTATWAISQTLVLRPAPIPEASVSARASFAYDRVLELYPVASFARVPETAIQARSSWQKEVSTSFAVRSAWLGSSNAVFQTSATFGNGIFRTFDAVASFKGASSASWLARATFQGAGSIPFTAQAAFSKTAQATLTAVSSFARRSDVPYAIRASFTKTNNIPVTALSSWYQTRTITRFMRASFKYERYTTFAARSTFSVQRGASWTAQTSFARFNRSASFTAVASFSIIQQAYEEIVLPALRDMSASYELWISDPAGNNRRIIETYSELSGTIAEDAPGTLRISVPGDELFYRVRKHSRVEVWRSVGNMVSRLVGNTIWFVMSKQLDVDDDGIVTTVIDAESAMTLLKTRIIPYTTTSVQGYKITYADDMMKQIVRENFTTGSLDTERHITGRSVLRVENDYHLGPPIEKTVAYRNVFEVLQEISDTAYGKNVPIYFDITATSGTSPLIFRTFINQRGVDRRNNSNITFGTDSGVIGAYTITEDWSEEPTFVYAGGEGEDQERIIGTAEDYERLSEDPFGRVEVWTDVRDATSLEELEGAAQSFLTENRTRRTFEGEIRQAPGVIFMIHWDVGDILPITIDGEVFPSRVSSVDFSFSDGEESITARMRGN